MRVIVDVKAYYDWEPVPPDVMVTEQDLRSGRVKPGARNGNFLMKVKKVKDTYTECMIAESTIIARIIHEMMPQEGSTPLTRKDAIGNLMAKNIMPHHAHPSFMKKFTVEDDGPDEALFRQMVTPYTVAPQEEGGEPLIHPDELESMVARYLEPSAPQDHVDHLHKRFNVKKVVSK